MKDNICIKYTWIDGLDQDDLMISFDVTASSCSSSVSCECDYSTFGMRDLGETMVAHSFDPVVERSISIDVFSEDPPRLRVVLHEANVNGRLPIEMAFMLEDELVGRYPATVVVWAELGQLERFGKKLAALTGKGVGASCELNPEVI